MRIFHGGFLMPVAAGAFLVLQMAPAGAQPAQPLCAAKADDDTLQPLPAPLVPQARALFGLSPEMPAALVQKSTVYRCMNGKAWLCNSGANLTCGKANTSRKSPGAASFCKENPGASVVPMAATGHDTIYQWSCSGKKARVAQQIADTDPRGFIAVNWKPLE
ncbi:MAG TPA: hypothetical protein VFG05_13060 [Methylocella sp.]|nr:hypothetical protein [Methylocella sp.]